MTAPDEDGGQRHLARGLSPTRAITALHARAPSGANVTLMRAASIDSTRHPSAKLPRSSSSVTPRPELARHAVAEAKEKDVSAKGSDCAEVVDIPSSLFVVEDMEQSRIHNSVELLAQ